VALGPDTRQSNNTPGRCVASRLGRRLLELILPTMHNRIVMNSQCPAGRGPSEDTRRNRVSDGDYGFGADLVAENVEGSRPWSWRMAVLEPAGIHPAEPTRQSRRMWSSRPAQAEVTHLQLMERTTESGAWPTRPPLSAARSPRATEISPNPAWCCQNTTQLRIQRMGKELATHSLRHQPHDRRHRYAVLTSRSVYG
jgi:hypothetical protein